MEEDSRKMELEAQKFRGSSSDPFEEQQVPRVAGTERMWKRVKEISNGKWANGIETLVALSAYLASLDSHLQMG